VQTAQIALARTLYDTARFKPPLITQKRVILPAPAAAQNFAFRETFTRIHSRAAIGFL